MPKYRLSPEERAAEKERKDHLRAIMQGLDIKSCDYLKDAFKLMVGEMPKNGLEGEPDDEFGCTKYDASPVKTAATAIQKNSENKLR